jgi:hypothetical protein
VKQGGARGQGTGDRKNKAACSLRGHSIDMANGKRRRTLIDLRRPFLTPAPLALIPRFPGPCPLAPVPFL